MRKSSVLIGAVLATASLALAAPAMAGPAPTPGLSDAISTAAAAPGTLASSAPKSAISVQNADLNGARVGFTAAGGAHSKPATDGIITPSASYTPAS